MPACDGVRSAAGGARCAARGVVRYVVERVARRLVRAGALAALLACGVAPALAQGEPPSTTPGAVQCAADDIPLAEIRANQTHILQGPLDVEALERAQQVTMPATGTVLPLVADNPGWREFKDAIQPGDELYAIERTQRRYYMSGYILVRGGCVVRTLVNSAS